MKLNSLTNIFVKNYVFPYIEEEEINVNNVKDIIQYIVENYETPLSNELALGNDIDYEFFLSVNAVLNDLSLNSNL